MRGGLEDGGHTEKEMKPCAQARLGGGNAPVSLEIFSEEMNWKTKLLTHCSRKATRKPVRAEFWM